jgi:hypothetical protein
MRSKLLPIVVGFAFCVTASFALAQNATNPSVDLILPPVLANKDAPIYRGAKVKIGDEVFPVLEGALPDGQVAVYDPKVQAVIVSDQKSITEQDKNAALFDVLQALEVGAIAPAAGKEQQ